MTYIEKQTLKEELLSNAVRLNDTKNMSSEDVLYIIDKQPTADVEEVKHGEWFLLDDCANEGVYCSACHKKVYKKCYANQKLKSKYCPNCGTKMDGERKKNDKE